MTTNQKQRLKWAFKQALEVFYVATSVLVFIVLTFAFIIITNENGKEIQDTIDSGIVYDPAMTFPTYYQVVESRWR